MRETTIQWVDVQDIAPDNDRPVLIAWENSDRVVVARRNIYMGTWHPLLGNLGAEPTYWADFPPPPNEGAAR